MDLKNIKGIGPKLLISLNNQGINDINSLIFKLPSSYQIYKLNGFSYVEEFNAKGTIIDEVKLLKLKNNTKVSFDILIGEMKYTCIMFNMIYVSKAFHIGDEVVIVGSYDSNYKSILVNKIFKEKDYKEGIIPEYNLENIPNQTYSKLVKEALNYYKREESIIPDSYFNKYNYKTGFDLLNQIHFPKDENDIKESLDALKYSELLNFAIKLAIIRKKQSSLRNEKKNYDIEALKAFISLGINFELTDDQKKAVNDICKYLSSDIPLNMLLEGDVGSGKTIVAIIASYAVSTSGFQTLVMVPTEALAIQHYNSFRSYLDKFNVNVEVLTSSTKKTKRNEILKGLENGEIEIIIGTHSLLSDEVKFKNLGFVVCDEQHKFGVEQRKLIREKGTVPDTLYMTATPIPRTLALTIFNDLTLEEMRTLPLNKKRIKTFIHTYKDYLKVLKFVKSEIDENRQAYFVAPRIDDDESNEVQSVLKIKEDLEKIFKGVNIGLLHGKMKEDEKRDALLDFLDGKTKILVSTTVVEVGINNKNASVMVIIDAHRFGLSTLHQLRGRVGRGDIEGYAFLMIDNKEYLNRLSILEETQDGFLISEADLKERGPGDFLGTMQSGMIKFNYANIFKDKNIFDNAKKDALELIEDERTLNFYESKLFSSNFD